MAAAEVAVAEPAELAELAEPVEIAEREAERRHSCGHAAAGWAVDEPCADHPAL